MKTEYKISFVVLAVLLALCFTCMTVHASEVDTEIEVEQIEEIVTEENTENKEEQEERVLDPAEMLAPEGEITEEQTEESNTVEETITDIENEQLTQIINILNEQAEIEAENIAIQQENEAKIIELLNCILFMLVFAFAYDLVNKSFLMTRTKGV